MRAPGARAPRSADPPVPPPPQDDGWTVVKVAIPPPLDNLSTEIRADERPEIAEDPRDAHMRNVGPWVGRADARGCRRP